MYYLQVYPEGTHFMIPWFERPIIYDVRARPNLVESTSGSRDLQMVRLHLFNSIFSSLECVYTSHLMIDILDLICMLYFHCHCTIKLN